MRTAALLALLFALRLAVVSPSQWMQHLWQGKPYWFNPSTRETRWDRPSDLYPSQPQQRQQQQGSSAAAYSSAADGGVERKYLRPSRSSRQTAQTSSASSTTSSVPSGASPSELPSKKSIVVDALKTADRRIDEMQTALDEMERNLVRERRLRIETEDNSTALTEELTQSLRELEEDYFELKRQLTVEKAKAAQLEARVKSSSKDKEELRGRIQVLEANKRRTDSLPQHIFMRLFGGLVGVSSSSSSSSSSAGKKGGTPTTSSASASGSGSVGKASSRTLAVMKANMSALVESVKSKEQIIRDLALQINEYQEEGERRKGSYDELRRKVSVVLADRERLLDMVETLSANTCDMAVKMSLLQRFCSALQSELSLQRAALALPSSLRTEHGAVNASARGSAAESPQHQQQAQVQEQASVQEAATAGTEAKSGARGEIAEREATIIYVEEPEQKVAVGEDAKQEQEKEEIKDETSLAEVVSEDIEMREEPTVDAVAPAVEEVQQDEADNEVQKEDETTTADLSPQPSPKVVHDDPDPEALLPASPQQEE